MSQPVPGFHRRRLRYLKALKEQVRSNLGVETQDVIRYSESYQEHFLPKWIPASETEVFQEVNQSQVVFGGDFHAHPQSQRTHLRILREVPQERHVILGLEAMESRYQEIIDRFLAGKLSENRFLDLTQWEKRWGFAWAQYRPLVELARERGWKVFGLNRRFSRRTAESLSKRDVHAAQIIERVRQKNRESLFYVVFGDLHLAPGHLPDQWRSLLQKMENPKTLLVLQDSEKLYWRLVRQGQDAKTHILKNRNHFCIMTSPPWVKWKNYLLHLESDVNDEYKEDGTFEVHEAVRLLNQDLGLEVSDSDLSVYSPEDEGVWNGLKTHLPERDLPAAEALMEEGKTFLVPSGGVAVLARPSQNHGAHLAAEFLQVRLSGRKRVLWEMPNDFEKRIWVDALSFALSKLINPSRKPDQMKLLEQRVQRGDRGLSEALRIMVGYRRSELFRSEKKMRKGRTQKAGHRSGFLEAARLLGAMLGDRIFQALREGVLRPQELVNWLKIEVDDVHFDEQFLELMRRFEGLNELSQHRRL